VRDLRILTCAAQGMTNVAIGRDLGLSEHTVKAAISRILAQLGLRHRTEAVVHAIREGWIESPTGRPAPTNERPFVDRYAG
jgi:two-component system response regulator DegU